jgi:sugar transferase (PEP-CTERM/EpsH1 system associated)
MKSPTNSYSPLVVHVIYRLAVGGMENGLVNLINHMPPARYRHSIVCLTSSTRFRSRLKRDEVSIIELKKAPGHDFRSHQRFWQILRQLRPDIVHTRNLGTLEFQFTAAMAGVQGRIHGEHGRDTYDLDGTSTKYKMLRKAMRPFVRQYTAVSVDLARWLINTIRIRADRVNQIYNGVDIVKFSPHRSRAARICPEGFAPPGAFVVGTVGRMEPVKDQITLVKAFLNLVTSNQTARQRMRLIIIGAGSLYRQAKEMLLKADADSLAWLPGEREDVPDLMRAMDLFVLPSLREGISNTILEAMATGLPVVATNTGGNPEIVCPGETGELVPPVDPIAMATAIASYFADPRRVAEDGRNAREEAVRRFSMQAMVNGYLSTYDSVLENASMEKSPRPLSSRFLTR